MDDLVAPETRDVTVGSSVQRHQLRQYLNAHGIEGREWPSAGGRCSFAVTATEEEWEGIDQWIERTKVTK